MSLETMIAKLLAASPSVRAEVARVLEGRPTQTRPEEDQRLVSVTAAARLLGISRSAAYGLIKSGRLSTVRMNGRNRMVRRASIDEFLHGEDKKGVA